jgi:hypothetical protein
LKRLLLQSLKDVRYLYHQVQAIQERTTTFQIPDSPSKSIHSCDVGQRHIDSVERVIGSCGDGDLVLVCGDFNLTGVVWSHQDDELCPSNVMSAREFIVFDGMANSDLVQVNPIPNQYGVVCFWILSIAIFLKWLLLMLLKGFFKDWIGIILRLF